MQQELVISLIVWRSIRSGHICILRSGSSFLLMLTDADEFEHWSQSSGRCWQQRIWLKRWKWIGSVSQWEMIDTSFIVPADRRLPRWTCNGIVSDWREHNVSLMHSRSIRFSLDDVCHVSFQWIIVSQILISLNLSANQIDDAGAQHLADALRVNQVKADRSCSKGWSIEVLVLDTDYAASELELCGRWRCTTFGWSFESQSSTIHYWNLRLSRFSLTDTHHLDDVYKSYKGIGSRIFHWDTTGQSGLIEALWLKTWLSFITWQTLTTLVLESDVGGRIEAWFLAKALKSNQVGPQRYPRHLQQHEKMVVRHSHHWSFLAITPASLERLFWIKHVISTK